jgi:hypothetical protein
VTDKKAPKPVKRPKPQPKPEQPGPILIPRKPGGPKPGGQ